jgi:hypothetical protein
MFQSRITSLLAILVVLIVLLHYNNNDDINGNCQNQPYENNCVQFFQCVDGKLSTCPFDMYFNINTFACENRPFDCGDRPAFPPSDTPFHGSLPDLNDCKKFYHSMGSHMVHLSCSEDFYYNIDESACRQGTSHCGSRPVYT